MQKKQNEYLDIQLKLQLQTDANNYSHLLIQQDEQQKILIHDIKNHLQSIKALASQTDTSDAILQYIDDLDISSRPIISSNNNLDLILNRYKMICREKQIPFDIDVHNSNVDFLTLPEITALFCNLLDNALEATIKSSKPYIQLRIVKKKDLLVTVINLVNSCQDAPRQNRDGFLISSKENSKEHGFGLRSVHKIISSYNGIIHTYYNEKEQLFHTIITIEHERSENL